MLEKMFGFRKRRRKKLLNRPLPEHWQQTLWQRVPHYRLLPEADRMKLHGLIQVFLAEKNFEGCGGFEINDEVRLTVAGQACLMILGGISDYYPYLQSILIYPEEYMAPFQDYTEGGVVVEGVEPRSGESWDMGSLVLSWRQVEKGVRSARDGVNLVFHEFAHQLDHELGLTSGSPAVSEDAELSDWYRVLVEHYEWFFEQVERGWPVFMDSYGAEDISEFFAVSTEYFFERPGDLMHHMPYWYRQLSLLYCRDTLEWHSA